MVKAKRFICIAFIIVLVLSTFIFPVNAVEEDTMQPYLHYTTCPNCNTNNLAAVGPVSNQWYGTPTYCEIDPSMADGHMHIYRQEYSLYRCYSCGYERRMNYIGTQTCPVTGRVLSYNG